MNSVETIQAAIDKLTRLRQMSDEETFKLVGEGPALYLGYWYVASSVDPSSITPEDAELIVTLHATIDAQLLIMRNELEEIAIDKEASGFERPPHHDVFTLARAIVGDEVAR